jgi:hypothetical protein
MILAKPIGWWGKSRVLADFQQRLINVNRHLEDLHRDLERRIHSLDQNYAEFRLSTIRAHIHQEFGLMVADIEDHDTSLISNITAVRGKFTQEALTI